MLLALILSALAMTLIVGLRYLLTSGAFALVTRRRHPGLYVGLDKQIRREIGWSLASAAIYGVPAGLVAWAWQNLGWTRIYGDVHAWPLWYLPVSVLRVRGQLDLLTSDALDPVSRMPSFKVCAARIDRLPSAAAR